jgi:hypothetical protein
MGTSFVLSACHSARSGLLGSLLFRFDPIDAESSWNRRYRRAGEAQLNSTDYDGSGFGSGLVQVVEWL